MNYELGEGLMLPITDFIALDVETANADFASICSIGLVHFKADQIFKSLTILVDPEDHFDSINIGIHGIRPEDVVGKPTMAQVIPIVRSFLTDVVVVHHNPFDKTAISRAATKYDTANLNCVWLDNLRVARRIWPECADSGGYGLKRLAADFQIEFLHHGAAEDARAAGLVMLRAMTDSGLGLEEWLAKVEQPIVQYSGRYAEFGNPAGHLFGETVAFTGTLSVSRGVAAKIAAEAGCTVADGVSKQTTILVVGDQDLRRTKGEEKSSRECQQFCV